MNYFEEAYIQYIDDLHYHLFEGKTLEEIFAGISESHRKRRFVAMYLLRDPKTFHSYFEKRFDLGLEGIFNQVISALFFEKDKLLIKRKLIAKLELNRGMVRTPVSEHDLRVLTKDLQAFVWHATKQILLSPVV